MTFVRRSMAIFLAFIATITLVAALVVRVAYNTVFDTDTYVETVSSIGQLDSMQGKVSTFVSDSLVNGAQLDSPQYSALFRKVGVNQATFRDTVAKTVYESVNRYMKSEAFITLWASTNRTAHTQLMTLVKNDSPITQDFVVDLSPLVKAAATSLDDPTNAISKVIPLNTFVPTKGTFEFKLIQAKSVEDLRTAVDIAGKARTGLLLSSLVVLALAWLLFGRTRGAHRLVAIAFVVAGTITLVIKAVGKNVVHGVVDVSARDSADAIYAVTTSPLTTYAVVVLILGIAGFGATFYRRTN